MVFNQKQMEVTVTEVGSSRIIQETPVADKTGVRECRKCGGPMLREVDWKTLDPEEQREYLPHAGYGVCRPCYGRQARAEGRKGERQLSFKELRRLRRLVGMPITEECIQDNCDACLYCCCPCHGKLKS